MRRYHRWISIVFSVVIVYVAITGSILAIDEFFDPATFAEGAGGAPGGPGGPGGGPGAPRPAATLPSDRLDAMTRTALRAALASEPAASLHALKLRLEPANGRTQAVVTLGEDTPRVLRFDAETGAAWVAAPPRPERPPNLNATLQSLHSGAIVGRGAQWLVLATGVALVVLAFTGIWLFFQMLGARRRIGRRQWFWRTRG